MSYKNPNKDLTQYDREPFIIPEDTELTGELVLEYIEKHKARIPRYTHLRNEYEGAAQVLGTEKPDYKPNNKLVVNYPKYLVTNFEGYFAGKPPTVEHKDDLTDEKLRIFKLISHFEDVFAEVSKLCSLFGHGYTLLYQDERARTRFTWETPENAFVIYDDTVEELPLYGVRYNIADDRSIRGYVYTRGYSVEFYADSNDVVFDEPEIHFYDSVPLVEWIQNEERISIIETVHTLIHAYNKGLSEKANDVDYFADAYLKVIGAKVDEDSMENMRDNRTINFEGDGLNEKPPIVEFLDKPNGDETQENLLNRLERLIHKISQVPDINSEDFASAPSGESLERRLQPLQNLAQTKERKFKKALQNTFEMWFNVPANAANNDDWMDLKYKFYRTHPKPTISEIELAQSAEGLLSQETRLSFISEVDNVKDEIERLRLENESD